MSLVLTKLSRTFNLEPKIFGYFRHMLRLEIRLESVVTLQINTLKFIKTQSSTQKRKTFKFGTKNTLFRYSWNAISKKVFSCLKSTPSIFTKCKVFVQNKKSQS